MKKLFLNYLHFIKSQFFLTQIQCKPFVKMRIIIGAIFEILLKPFQIVNKDLYFKSRKFFIGKIYKNIHVQLQNKKFKIRDNVDLMTLLADEGIDIILKKEGKVFLDIGAHIGKYSILYSDFYEKIYAFEPEPSNFSLLKENIKINSLENKIFPFQLAISDKVGRIELYLSKYSVTHSLIKDENINKILVDSSTLDEFLNKNNINFKDIACIKIDVEGAEHLVLKGMEYSLAFLKALLIIEIWRDNISNKQFVDEFLKKFNFQLRQIKGDYYLAYYENSSSK